MKENKYISKDELYIIVCDNIKKYRNECGLTQLQLSEEIEISHEYLRQLESQKGQKDFTFYTLYKISMALKTPIDAFLKP
ncbi:MAG: helix-turn-helix transcriptional regulator [Clostridiales bacterium]|nr:helix-turn-helix transcriptional regulator [Clostridiales bacterium]